MAKGWLSQLDKGISLEQGLTTIRLQPQLNAKAFTWSQAWLWILFASAVSTGAEKRLQELSACAKSQATGSLGIGKTLGSNLQHQQEQAAHRMLADCF